MREEPAARQCLIFSVRGITLTVETRRAAHLNANQAVQTQQRWNKQRTELGGERAKMGTRATFDETLSNKDQTQAMSSKQQARCSINTEHIHCETPRAHQTMCRHAGSVLAPTPDPTAVRRNGWADTRTCGDAANGIARRIHTIRAESQNNGTAEPQTARAPQRHASSANKRSKTLTRAQQQPRWLREGMQQSRHRWIPDWQSEAIEQFGSQIFERDK